METWRLMLALGIDFADAVTIGVAVDDAGKVLRQGRGTGSPSGIRTLLDELAAGHKPDAVGVAADSAGAGTAAVDGWPPPRVCTPGAAAVVAESWVGAARGARHVVCLLVGNRVTAGLLLNGEPWLGAHGAAGAAAWFALNPVERQATTGSSATLPPK